MNYDTSVFLKDLEQLNINISDRQVSQFLSYYELLIEWNQRFNLTAVTDFDEVFKKHFTDSLSLIRYYDMSKVSSIIDIGTGAGFPGIPLKIMLPDVSFLLLDSLNKRVNFLNEVVDSLSLEKIRCIHGRAEDLAREGAFREQFDLCVSRAVANLSTLSEYCLPFVKVGGDFVSYKTLDFEDERNKALNAISILGGSFTKAIQFELPGTDIGRSFLIIGKIKETSGKYPRRGALPKNKPL